MEKFEKKVRKRLKHEIEDFETWGGKHGVCVSEESLLSKSGNELVKQRFDERNGWAVIIGIAVSILLLCVVLLFVLHPHENAFSEEEDLRFETIEDSQIQTIANNFPELKGVTVLQGVRAYGKDSGKLIYSSFAVEYETEENYYTIDMWALHSNIDFMKDFLIQNKEQREIICGQYILNGYFVMLDESEFYWYRFISQNEDEILYWDIRCLENTLDEILSVLFVY